MEEMGEMTSVLEKRKGKKDRKEDGLVETKKFYNAIGGRGCRMYGMCMYRCDLNTLLLLY